MRHTCLALGMALTLLMTVGCGSRRPVVSGLVTLDGEPLKNGTIEFFPVRGDGQTAGALIGDDGRYRLETSATEMKVIIQATKVVGQRKRYADVPDSPTSDIVEELVPARYADIKKTELTYTVPPGESTKDFALTSDKKK